MALRSAGGFGTRRGPRPVRHIDADEVHAHPEHARHLAHVTEIVADANRPVIEVKGPGLSLTPCMARARNRPVATRGLGCAAEQTGARRSRQVGAAVE